MAYQLMGEHFIPDYCIFMCNSEMHPAGLSRPRRRASIGVLGITVGIREPEESA
jgi:hypothetical protein